MTGSGGRFGRPGTVISCLAADVGKYMIESWKETATPYVPPYVSGFNSIPLSIPLNSHIIDNIFAQACAAVLCKTQTDSVSITVHTIATNYEQVKPYEEQIELGGG